jgi:predicted RNA-binding Zn ribbon-like protein
MSLDLPEGPLTPGPEHWYWLGGRPALDFVNTRRERWRRSLDCLTSAGDVVAWLSRAGLLEGGGAPLPRGLLGDARALREAIDACVQAAVAGVVAPYAEVAVIDGWLAHAVVPAQLGLATDGTPALGEQAPADPVRRALGMVALDAAHMLGLQDEAARIRICASDTCSARFYDRSPAGRRRWCSMQACGNVEKARRHRAATRPAGPAA